jgi:outer membrane protein assembly factor BamB
MRRIVWFAALFLTVQPARAVIIKKVSVKDLMASSTFICTMKVDGVDPQRPSMVLLVDADLKGKMGPRRLPVNLKGDRFAKDLKHTPELLKRVVKDLPLFVFVQEKPDQFIAFAYTNGTWFQMVGMKEKESVRWSFMHCEPYFRRTFKGTTAELRQAVEDVLANRKAPPPFDDHEKPGLGPEIKSAPKSETRNPKPESRRTSAPGSPVFGVIVGLPAGGIIGALALLFPAVFGGLAILMRRWAALVSVVFTNSTLYMARVWFAEDVRGYWWGSWEVLWTTMILLTGMGAVWAWVRQLRFLDPDSNEAPMPERTEKVSLGVMSVAGLAGIVTLLILKDPQQETLLNFLLITSAGFWAGWLFLLARRWMQERRRLSTEGIALCCMAGVAILLTAHSSSGKVEGSKEVTSATSSEGPRGAVLKRQVWKYTPDGQSTISSSPVVVGKNLYAGIIHGDAFSQFGRVYCLDRETGQPGWKQPFDEKGKMKQMFSSPCIGERRLFVGEGFHEDTACRLFCLRAATGEKLWMFPKDEEEQKEEDKLWDFPTNGHIESTPCYSDGRVFFGYGDKGIYCLHYRAGKKLWQYPEPGDRRRGLHVDASPTVAGNRLYCCSGKSQLFQRYCIFCLDATTGKKVWETDTDLPVWGSPTVNEGRVFVGLGNSRIGEKVDYPRGAVLCLDAFDGRRLWRFDMKGTVHTRPACDGVRVFAGSQDGHCYALDMRDGSEVWKRDLGSMVEAAPAMARGAWGDRPAALYVAAIKGDVYCLDPKTGSVYWHFDELSKDSKNKEESSANLISSLTVSVRRTKEGDERRIYFASTVNRNSASVVYCLEDEWIGEPTDEDR